MDFGNNMGALQPIDLDAFRKVADDMMPVYETERGDKFISARDLHEKMLIGKDFSTWMKDRIDKYGFIEGEDFSPILVKSSNGGRPKTEYLLKIDIAKEIAMVQNNEMGRAIRKYFIEVEKRFRQQNQKPQSQAEMLLLYAQQMVDTERRVSALEKEQQNVREIVGLNNMDWRRKVNGIMQKAAFKMGGYNAYQEMRNQSYEILEQRAKCSLSRRKTNKQQKMALEGVPKSKVEKVTKMDVIADDARLTEIYLAIVKEIAIRYQIDAGELEAAQ